MYQIRLVLCSIQWFIAFIFPLYYTYWNCQLEFDTVSYIWIIPNKSSISLILYILIIQLILPVFIILSIYIKLTLFIGQVRRSNIFRGITSNQYELQTCKYVVLLLTIMALSLLPEVVFQTMKDPPNYEYRIDYLLETLITLGYLIFLFFSTTIVKQKLNQWKKKIKRVLTYRKERSTILQ